YQIQPLAGPIIPHPDDVEVTAQRERSGGVDEVGRSFHVSPQPRHHQVMLRATRDGVTEVMRLEGNARLLKIAVYRHLTKVAAADPCSRSKVARAGRHAARVTERGSRAYLSTNRCCPTVSRVGNEIRVTFGASAMEHS